MAPSNKTILVTGGCGFIGSALVRHIMATTEHTVVNVDALTYAAHPGTNASFAGDNRYRHEIVDIADASAVESVIRAHRPCGIIHLAAESHVDRSIDSPLDFVRTNVTGSATLLHLATSYWRELEEAERSSFRFHHVSTDEVFGSLGETGIFTEESPYAPNSPYAASKAASDHFVRAWATTYGLPVVISNCSNNFGPYQFPEKLIPLIIIKALAGENLPVYGKGENVRDWLYVTDHAEALWTIFTGGRNDECYNVGGDAEKQNIEVVREICSVLDQLAPADNGRAREELITFVTDRPGHDFRYAVSCEKLRNELGWHARKDFTGALKETVSWYLDNRDWWQAILEGTYAGERLGLGD